MQVRQGDARDHLQGVDHVAQALGHLPAVRVAHNPVEENRVEGKLPCEANRHHHHPRHPEEQDVRPSLQEGRGEKSLEVFVAFCVWPAEHREREKAGGEPGVQHIVVLYHLHALHTEPSLGFRDRLLRCPAGEPHFLLLLRLRNLVGGDAVAPPQLPRDTPLLDVFQPVEPGLVVKLWEDPQIPLAQSLNAPVGKVFAVHPPLGLQVWLDDVLRTRADAQAHRVRLLAHPEVLLLQRLFDRLPGLETVLPGEGPAQLIDAPGLVEDVDLLEAVPHAALEVVLVVRRGDLHAARAEVLLHHGVGHHDHLALGEERVLDGLPMEGLVAVVLGVHGHGHVAQHRLQPGRGHDQEVAAALHRVLELAEHADLHLVVIARDGEECLAWDVLVVHLKVGEGRPQVRAPVHQSVVAVNEALVVEADEGLLHGPRQQAVHGEPLPRPVHAGGDPAELGADLVAVLLLPGPDALQELLAAEVVPRDLLRLVEQPLHDALRRDARVVGARHPQGHVAAHPVPAREGVLDGPSQRVAQVQDARDVGRGDHHDEPLGLCGVFRLGGVRGEKAFLLPPRTPSGFHGDGVIACNHLGGSVLLLPQWRIHCGRRWLLPRCSLRLRFLVGFAGAWLAPLRLFLHHLPRFLAFLGLLRLAFCTKRFPGGRSASPIASNIATSPAAIRRSEQLIVI
mmetsp:Transcript_78936/g.239455  ORF Transcript_78936/g.239455 Transcript_78936/m.239455 type:complete len:678 (-) Transcript_78936:103-2136(-)